MQQIKELRERYGWTQEDLSWKLGVSLNTIKGWEKKSNPRHPGIKNRYKLNELLIAAGIEKILPTKQEVDDLLGKPEVMNNVADSIIESGDI